jgi:hypothetical protein
MDKDPDRLALDADPDPQHWSWYLLFNKIPKEKKYYKETYQNGAADYKAVRDPFFPL